MVTIEQCEADIEAKAEIIRSELEKFEENIGRIGSVIGKDATVVYQTLTNKFNEVINAYNTSTRRNVEILTAHIGTLDNIQMVLNDVMLAIDKIDSDKGEDLTSRIAVNDLMEKVAESTDSIATKVEEVIEKAVGKELPSSTMKPIIFGGGAFLLGKLLGLSTVFNVAGATAAAYYASKKQSKEA